MKNFLKKIFVSGGGDYKKIYTFIADINTLQPVWGANIAGFQRTVSMPLWKRVLSGFCQSDFENSLLIVWTGKNSNQTDLQVLSDYISSFGNNAGKNIIVYPSTEEEIFSPCIVRNSTHFITTREIISLECMDYLWDTDVRIVSALDEDIFENEPRVEWGKIFEGV